MYDVPMKQRVLFFLIDDPDAKLLLLKTTMH
jgi:hypothetical protein